MCTWYEATCKMRCLHICFCFEVEAEVTLRLTVSQSVSQSVSMSWSRAPLWDLRPDITSVRLITSPATVSRLSGRGLANLIHLEGQI
jgi:hypothetical protein